MNSTVANQSLSAHRVIADIHPQMAKADLRKPDVPPMRLKLGTAIRNVAGGVGWNLDQLAAAVGRDPRQVSRWLDGTERPHFDVLFDVPELREPLLFAIARLVGAHVSTTARSAA